MNNTQLTTFNFKPDFGNEQLNNTALAVNGSMLELIWINFQRDKQALEEFYLLHDSSAVKNTLHYINKDNYINLATKEVALDKLQKDYWNKLIIDIGIRDHMPAKRKEAWAEQVEKSNSQKVIPFTQENIQTTLIELLKEQGTFTAEKVETAFCKLSKEHITNRPSGFYKRCIFNIVNQYGYVDVHGGTASYVHDLRYVINLLTKRLKTIDIKERDTQDLLDSIPCDGQWYWCDGNAWKIRRYLKGTAHLEFNNEIAWQLNSILAMSYQGQIPKEFRRTPEKDIKNKHVELLKDHLSNEVIYEIRRILNHSSLMRTSPLIERDTETNSFYIVTKNKQSCPFSMLDKHLTAEIERVLSYIGGVKIDGKWHFSYNPYEALLEITHQGCVPDKVSHQYYPTQEVLAMELTYWLDIQEGDAICEPSAGQGGIAQFLNKEATLIEVNPLHCLILKEKEFTNVINEDFITYAKKAKARNERYDVIAMNPPFSENRAKLHLFTALELLKTGGRLGAILPLSAKNYSLPTGFNYEFSTSRNNCFNDTNVIVVLLKATKL